MLQPDGISRGLIQAQLFETGSRSEGYDLTSVTLRFSVDPATTLSAEIYSVKDSGSPDTALYTLNVPDNLESGAISFTAPGSGKARLEPNTTYAVVIADGSKESGVHATMKTTESKLEDDGKADGWSIANRRYWRSSGSDNWTEETDLYLKIRIRGVLPSPASGQPVITGVAQEGEVLSAGLGTIADANGLPTTPPNTFSSFPDDYSLQWVRVSGGTDTDIPGATSGTYTLTADDVGSQVKVKVTFTDGEGYAEGPLTSDPTPLNATIPPKNTVALVSNVGQTVSGLLTLGTGYTQAQQFTTGSFADGYRTSRVYILVSEFRRASHEPQVSIYSDNNDLPGTLLHRLTNPSDIGAGLREFVGATRLKANTRYWVVVELSSGTLSLLGTSSDAEDDGGAAGWQIADRSFVKPPGESWNALPAAKMGITIRGMLAPNHEATGQPATTGAARAGELLAADVSGIGDENGTTEADADDIGYAYIYQWIHADGEPETEIDRATSHTYTLTADDAGKTIKVAVEFVDDADNAERPLTSAVYPAMGTIASADGNHAVAGAVAEAAAVTVTPTALRLVEGGTGVYTVVLGSAPSDTVTIAIGGTAGTDVSVDDDTLTFTATDWATAQTVTVSTDADADTGNDEVTLTHTPAGGGYDAVTMASVAVTVLEGFELKASLDPAEQSVEEGDKARVTLRIVLSDEPAGTVGYRVQTDAGTASAGDDYKPVAPRFREVAASQFTAVGDGRYAYERRFNLTTVEDTEAESNETFHFKVSALDLTSGGSYTTVIEGAADGALIQINDDDNAAATGQPAITGTARQGQVLTAGKGTIADGNGTTRADFGNRGYAYTYQWIRVDGETETEVGRATSYRHTYTLTAEDVGKTIKLAVEFVDDADNSEGPLVSEEFPATGTVAMADGNHAATGVPAITGTARAGQVLTADLSGIADEDGTTSAANGVAGYAYRYQWIRVDSSSATDITGATAKTYPLTAADAGKTVKVRVSFSDDADFAEGPLTSAAYPGTGTIAMADGNHAATGAPAITGTGRVGRVLTAHVGGIADEDGTTKAATGDAGYAYTYQWIRVGGETETDIIGATAKTYRLAAADAGKTLKVRVSFVDDADYDEGPLTSAAYPATVIVAMADGNHVATGVPAITGRARAGRVLTADLSGIVDGDGTTKAATGVTGYAYTYQWIRVNGETERDITRATSKTYRLKAADLGRTLKVRVSFVDDAGFAEGPLVSEAFPATGTVAMADGNHAATGVPAITGTARAGRVLTAHLGEIADEDGTTRADAGDAGFAYTYQWIRVVGTTETDIPGATGSTYRLAADDAGLTVKVKVSFTDDADYDEGPLVSDRYPSSGTVEMLDPAAPALSRASVVGTSLVLVYDESLDAGSVPGPDAFSVKVDGGVATISEASIAGSAVTLTLAAAVVAGETVTVSYTVPTGIDPAPIQDLAGNDAAALTDEPVHNDNGVTSVVSIAAAETTAVYRKDAVTYTVTRTGFPGAALPVTVALSQDKDFLASSGLAKTVTIPANEVKATLTVLASQFKVFAAGERIESGTLTATVQDAADYDVGTEASADVAIVVAVTIGFEMDTYTVDESDGTLDVKVVVRTGVGAEPPARNIFAAVGSLEDTAESQYDFLPLSKFVRFTPTDFVADGNVYRAENTLTVTIVDDSFEDSGERFRLQWGMAPGQRPEFSNFVDADGNACSSCQTIITITDNDATSIVSDGVAITSTPVAAADTYGAGEAITFTATFDKPVDVDTDGGTPRIKFGLGASGSESDQYLDYVSGSGTDTLTFQYIVQSDDADSDGISVAADALELNGGSIADAVSGEDASLEHAAPGTNGAFPNHKVDGTQAPSIASLTALSLSEVTISPVFAAATTRYTASVEHAVSVTTVTATPETGASAAIVPVDAFRTEGHQVALAQGANEITVTVTKGGSAPRTYVVVVTRAAPPRPPRTTLISSLGQAGFLGSSPIESQGFTTGGVGSEYVLTSVRIEMGWTGRVSESLLIRIFSTDSSGRPDTELYRLRTPARVVHDAVNTFNAPSNARLARNTTYAVVLTAPDGINESRRDWRHTLSVEEDSGGAAGWSIADVRYIKASPSANWLPSGYKWITRMAITGYAIPDTTAPVLSSATVDGDTLVLTYDEPLDEDSVPGTDAFSVKVGGGAGAAPADVAVAGSAVTLTLAAAVTEGQMVTVSYTVPTGMDAAPIRDPAGNDAAAFTDLVVAYDGNYAATGVPAITGTARAGQVLTADLSGIADGNGTTKAANGDAGYAYTYQWIRVDGSSEADITGATSKTYTLTADDVGKTVKVRVSFKDDADHGEGPLTSAAYPAAGTVAMADGNHAATGVPAITGTARAGQVLTADLSGIADEDGTTKAANGAAGYAYTYQWIRVATDSSETDIAGATSKTYTLTADDVGKTVKVKVSFTDDADYDEGPLFSAAYPAAGTVAKADGNHPATGVPAITGTARAGQVLTADLSGIADEDGTTNADNEDAGYAYRYQWIRVEGDRETDIAGATSGTYTLTADEVGKTVKVRVSFTDDADHAEGPLVSAAYPATGTIVRVDGNYAATGAPAITGRARAGRMLTADLSGIADEEGTTKAANGDAGFAYTYQWIRVDGSSETDIAGATSKTYTLTADEVGKTVKVRVSFVDDADHDEGPLTSAAYPATGTVAKADGNHAAAGAPVITGMARVGRVLTADLGAIADEDGTTKAANGDTGYAYTYQWIRVEGDRETDIMGATSGTYTLTTDEVGKTVKVRVSFVDDADYDEGPLVSAAYPAAGTVAMADGNHAATGVPAITGTAWVGQTLTADLSGIADEEGTTKADADEVGYAYAYQWIRVDGESEADIPGATSSTYDLVAADEGKTVKVKVSFTDDADNGEGPLVSAAYPATGTVAGTGGNHAATGVPAITGTAWVGQTLTADLSGIADEEGTTKADADEVGYAYAYQWIRVDGESEADILGATSSTYDLVAADEGKTVKVRVSFTDDADNGEGPLVSAAYPATGTVAGTGGNHAATGVPAITGTAWVGRTLTADLSGIADEEGTTKADADEVGYAYAYQWIRVDGESEADILGATSSTYDLVAADEGKTVKVRVSFTDDAGNGEGPLVSAAYPATGTVAGTGGNHAATGVPAITGTAWVGRTLTADLSGIADEEGTTKADADEVGYAYAYQWIRVDGESEADILGATSSTYDLVAADEGKTVKVRVSFTDDAGNGEGPLVSAAYPATGTVAMVDGNHAATGVPAITGTAWVGQTLTADLSGIADEEGTTKADADEVGYAYAYQWIRVDGESEADITGATSSTYDLVAADEGKTVKVRVSFTDGQRRGGAAGERRLPGHRDRRRHGRQPRGNGGAGDHGHGLGGPDSDRGPERDRGRGRHHQGGRGRSRLRLRVPVDPGGRRERSGHTGGHLQYL